VNTKKTTERRYGPQPAADRPGRRVARAASRAAWLVGAGATLLLGAGFAWTMEQPRPASPPVPLPPAEAALVRQADELDSRIRADADQLATLGRRVQDLAASASSLPSAPLPSLPPMPILPPVHSFTGAS
jgi:hypothetical protein